MKTILIVEDNEKNMKLARDILQVKGYRTIEATTGLAGLRPARQEAPDLILMDIQLPDISGIEVYARLRADPITAGIPAIAFTASVTQADRSRIMDAGFVGFLAKPINLKEFLQTIERVLEKAIVNTDAHSILVVDDTPANVKLLVDVLSARGYRTTSAASGEAALDRLSQEVPDLILLDVMMPGLCQATMSAVVSVPRSGRRCCRSSSARHSTPVAGTGQWHRSGRRRLPDQTSQYPGASGTRSLVAADQEAAGRSRPAGRRTRAAECFAGAAGPGSDRPARRLGKLKRFFSPQLAEALLTQ